MPASVVIVAVLTDATRLKRRRTLRSRRNSFHVSGRVESGKEDAVDDVAAVEDVEDVEVGVADVDAARIDSMLRFCLGLMGKDFDVARVTGRKDGFEERGLRCMGGAEGAW